LRITKIDYRMFKRIKPISKASLEGIVYQIRYLTGEKKCYWWSTCLAFAKDLIRKRNSCRLYFFSQTMGMEEENMITFFHIFFEQNCILRK